MYHISKLDGRCLEYRNKNYISLNAVNRPTLPQIKQTTLCYLDSDKQTCNTSTMTNEHALSRMCQTKKWVWPGNPTIKDTAP